MAHFSPRHAFWRLKDLCLPLISTLRVRLALLACDDRHRKKYLLNVLAEKKIFNRQVMRESPLKSCALKIRSFSSNHPKRIEVLEFVHALANKEPLEIPSIKTYAKNANSLVLVAGDSHAEFLSRVPFDSLLSTAVCCYWLGAVTLLGFSTNPAYASDIVSFTKGDRDSYCNHSRNINLILSLGEIDSRHVLYGLVFVKKKFANVQDALAFISSNFVKRIEFLRASGYFSTISIAQPPPPSSMRKYYSPRSEDDLNSYYAAEGGHPTLGCFDERLYIWREIDFLLKNVCAEHHMQYIERHPDAFSDGQSINPIHSYDDNHLTSRAIQESQLSLFNLL